MEDMYLNKLRKRLISVMRIRPLSKVAIAKEIGISRFALKHFLEGTHKTYNTIAAKIELYVQKYENK